MFDKHSAIYTILTAVDVILEERLNESGVLALSHIIVAIGPDGHALVRGNVDLARLKAVARELAELVDAQSKPSRAEPVH